MEHVHHRVGLMQLVLLALNSVKAVPAEQMHNGGIAVVVQ